jgi:spermidine synthase
MKPWILLDSATIPGGGELHLYQHIRDFAIRVGREELMNSGAHGSEEALATLAYARLRPRAQRRVLVGGLGMGFTVAAALRDLGADGRLTIVELVPAVVAWNRGPLAHLAGDPLADPRVSVQVGDAADVIARTRGTPAEAYDLILLDVDNGPHALTASTNHRLYGTVGLTSAHRALRPGGVLAVWSAGPDAAFTRRLRQVGFHAELVEARSHGRRGSRQSIWLASRR